LVEDGRRRKKSVELMRSLGGRKREAIIVKKSLEGE